MTEITTSTYSARPTSSNRGNYRAGRAERRVWVAGGVRFTRKHHAVRFVNEFLPNWNGEGDAEAAYQHWILEQVSAAREAGNVAEVRRWADLFSSFEAV